MYIIHVQDEDLYKLYKSRKGKYKAIQFLYIIVILNNNRTVRIKSGLFARSRLLGPFTDFGTLYAWDNLRSTSLSAFWALTLFPQSQRPFSLRILSQKTISIFNQTHSSSYLLCLLDVPSGRSRPSFFFF